MTISIREGFVKPTRQRRAPQEMRAQAIRAARHLLRDSGPQAITLKAVALRAGVTHGNVTYHFGTVDALHMALIAAITEDLAGAAATAVAHLRRGEIGAREVVDVVFDAFAADGAGRLVAWLAATGAGHRLAPLYAAVADLVGGLAEGDAGLRAGGATAIGRMVSAVVVPALGDALIGGGLQAALGHEPNAVRQVTADALENLRRK